MTWQALHSNGTACAPTTTDMKGLTSCSAQVYNQAPGVIVFTASAAGSVARFSVILTPSGANVSGFPRHTGPSTGRVGTRLPGPVIVQCRDRQGGPGGCSGRVTDASGTPMSGGTLLPVPGYRTPGDIAYYWILPSQPGTYYFWAVAPAGPNFKTATATP